MQTITVQELNHLRNSGIDFTLIDVREAHEYEEANLGGTLIPLNTLMENLDKIPKEGNVIMHCRSGTRSGNAIKMLEQREGYTNLKNLTGGILAWKDAYEPDMNVF